MVPWWANACRAFATMKFSASSSMSAFRKNLLGSIIFPVKTFSTNGFVSRYRLEMWSLKWKANQGEKRQIYARRQILFWFSDWWPKRAPPRLRHALHSKVAPLLRDFTWASPWLFISLKFVNTQNHSGLYVIKLKRLDRNGLTLESKLLKKGNRVKTIYRTFYIARDD